jgi:hypothetical protein
MNRRRKEIFFDEKHYKESPDTASEYDIVISSCSSIREGKAVCDTCFNGALASKMQEFNSLHKLPFINYQLKLYSKTLDWLNRMKAFLHDNPEEMDYQTVSDYERIIEAGIEQVLALDNKGETKNNSEKVTEEPLPVQKIHCNKCGHAKNHSVLSITTDNESSRERINGNLLEFNVIHTIQVLKCEDCSEYSFRKFTTNDNDVPNFPEKDEIIVPKRFDGNIRLPETFQHVPDVIIQIYGEAVSAYNNDLNICCAGAVRAIIEAICKNKGINGGDVTDLKNPGKTRFSNKMDGKIAGLAQNDVLTKTHANILHQHRFLGNEALHELGKPTKEELGIALGIVAHTLEEVFVLHVKGEELKKKREERTNP